MNKAIQLSFFDEPHRSHQIFTAGGFVAAIKAAMRKSIVDSGLSRAQVADEMNAIARSVGRALCKGSKDISIDTLEKWLASEERGQLPDSFGLHVLMLATRSSHPMDVWLAFFDCAVLDPVNRKRLEYAELTLQRKVPAKRTKQLEDELMGNF